MQNGPEILPMSPGSGAQTWVGEPQLEAPEAASPSWPPSGWAGPEPGQEENWVGDRREEKTAQPRQGHQPAQQGA